MSAPARLGVSAAFVDGEFVPGDVELAHGSIAAVGTEPATGSLLALPGYVDLQVNGFAGVDFTAASIDDYAAIGALLARTGVTAYQPTLISVKKKAAIGALHTLAKAHQHLAWNWQHAITPHAGQGSNLSLERVVHGGVRILDGSQLLTRDSPMLRHPTTNAASVSGAASRSLGDAMDARARR